MFLEEIEVFSLENVLGHGSKDDKFESWNVGRVLVEGIGIADELARGMDEEPAENRCSGKRHGRVLDRWGSVDEHRIRALEGCPRCGDHSPVGRMISWVANSSPPGLRERVEDETKVLKFQRRQAVSVDEGSLDGHFSGVTKLGHPSIFFI